MGPFVFIRQANRREREMRYLLIALFVVGNEHILLFRQEQILVKDNVKEKYLHSDAGIFVIFVLLSTM